MQMIIEAHLVDEDGKTRRVRLAAIERKLTTDPIGMTLAEGKALLAGAQQYFVDGQCRGIAYAHARCDRCDARLGFKGWHQRQIRTVFGRVTVRSARVRRCQCAGATREASFSPLLTVLPARVTPELEYLRVRWAAHLPYATAHRLMCEVLPIGDSMSVSGVKRRVRAVGEALEASSCAQLPKQASSPKPALEALAVDSAWLKHCHPPRTQGRHVNVVAGRACFDDGSTRVYSYVHSQVASAAERLDQFLAGSGVGPNERVTILTDGAGEFEKVAQGCRQPICRILDWFHIAMKFQAAERSVFGCKDVAPSERSAVESEIRSAKWLVWHGKAGKAVARFKALDQALLQHVQPGHEYGTLWWNVHKVIGYVRENPGLVNYARRHAKGLPVSSSIAESAVNEVVSLRMAKKRQMRWSDEGAHLLAQVRVRELNGELRPRVVPLPLRQQPKPSREQQWDALQEAA